MPDHCPDPPMSRRQAVGSVAAAILSAASAPVAAQARLPVLALRASDDQPVLADGARWRATYIDFWASWCTPCKLSFPWMNEMHDLLAGAGLRIVAISLDRREADAQRFLQRQPARFAVALDPAAESARLLDVTAMPSSYLVASDRRLLSSHRGFRLEDRAELERRLRAALA